MLKVAIELSTTTADEIRLKQILTPILV